MVSVDCGAVESRFLRLASRDLQMNPGLVVLDLDSPFVPHRWKKTTHQAALLAGQVAFHGIPFCAHARFQSFLLLKSNGGLSSVLSSIKPRTSVSQVALHSSGRWVLRQRPFGNFRCLNGTVWLAASFPVCLGGRSFRSNAGRTETILMPALQIPVCQSCAPSRTGPSLLPMLFRQSLCAVVA